ncbi:MAG: hypothetical protein Q8810_02450, partial [Candidatus Phytoplasma australasiaticum]|nr:hypothetical protein [Candidatus Phytoplasma australasiaticum]
VHVLLKYQEGENQEFYLTENNIKAVIMVQKEPPLCVHTWYFYSIYYIQSFDSLLFVLLSSGHDFRGE